MKVVRLVGRQPVLQFELAGRHAIDLADSLAVGDGANDIAMIRTAGLGIAMFPWKLLESTGGYIFTWLIGYSALLGPIAGIDAAKAFGIHMPASA